ncbi:MAG TPA: hypothetical protein VGH28_24435 [Polyangiaceae bacterium]|jgi:hypothetical protein
MRGHLMMNPRPMDPHDAAPNDEPQTPMWLPALGAVLFLAAGIYWVTRPEPAPPPPAPAAASASASAAPAPSASAAPVMLRH